MTSKRLASSAKRDAATVIEYIHEIKEAGRAPFLDDDITAQLCAAVHGHRDSECVQFRKPGKGRGKKPAGSPKNALNSYIFFAKDAAVRQDIINSFPGITPKEVTRKLGERWGAMSEADRAVYITLAVADKARYNGELSAYTSSMESSSSAAAPEVVVAAPAPAAAPEAEAAPEKAARKQRAPRVKKI